MSVQAADLVASLKGEDIGFVALMTRSGAAVNTLGTATGGAVKSTALLQASLAAIAVGALALTVKAASDFNTQLTQVQNNTTMTAADVDIMRTAVLKLASESNAPLDQLTTGFMHISNLGFSANDAVTVLTAAMKSATSTGGDTAKVADVLALQMHEFGLRATEASNAMDVLHLAAALGHATLDQFVSSTSKAVAMAANLNVPLTDVDAALSALSRHMNISDASTALAGALSKIINPSIAAQKELKKLSDATGIDLVGDFSVAGLKAKGLSGVLDDLKKATNGNTTELFQLIPALRGGQAAMILTGTGAQDYKDALLKLNEAMAGKLTPTADAFARSQKTLGVQLGELKNIFHVLAIEMGSVLLPAVTKVAAGLLPIAQSIVAFTDTHKGMTESIVKGVAGLATFVASLAGLKAVLSATKLAVGPVVEVLGLISAPVVAIGVAIAALVIAWKKDWGGIQEKTATVWAIVKPVFEDISTTIGDVTRAFQAGGLSAAWAKLGEDLPKILPDLKKAGAALGTWATNAWPKLEADLGTYKNNLGTWLGQIAPVIGRAVAEWAGKLGNWLHVNVTLSNAGDIAKTLLDAIGNASGPIRAKLAVWGQEFSNWIGPAATMFLKNWPAILNKVLDQIATAAGPILVQLGKWALQFTAWIIPLLPELGKKFLLINAAIFAFIGETAIVLGNKLVVWAVKMTEWLVVHAIPMLGPAFAKFLANLVHLVTDEAFPALTTAMDKLANAAAGWINVGWTRLQKLLGTFKDNLIGYFRDAGSWLYDAGQKIMSGLIAGIVSKFEDLKNDLGGLKDKIIGWKGPPSVDAVLLKGNGQLIMQGLITGINSQLPALQATLLGVTQHIGGPAPSGTRQAFASAPTTPQASPFGGSPLGSAGGAPIMVQILLDSKTIGESTLQYIKNGQYLRVGLV